MVSLASLGFATAKSKAKSKGKDKGQKAAKGGAKDVTASASKKKKPAAVVEETPSKRRRKKLYKPTFNTPAPSFEDVSYFYLFIAPAIRCAGPLLLLFWACVFGCKPC